MIIDCCTWDGASGRCVQFFEFKSASKLIAYLKNLIIYFLDDHSALWWDLGVRRNLALDHTIIFECALETYGWIPKTSLPRGRLGGDSCLLHSALMEPLHSYVVPNGQKWEIRSHNARKETPRLGESGWAFKLQAEDGGITGSRPWSSKNHSDRILSRMP